MNQPDPDFIHVPPHTDQISGLARVIVIENQLEALIPAHLEDPLLDAIGSLNTFVPNRLFLNVHSIIPHHGMQTSVGK